MKHSNGLFWKWRAGLAGNYILSAESQKGINAVHQRSIENQKAAITIDFVQ